MSAVEQPDSLPDIPSLRFDNRTEIDALHFDMLDQNGVPFHVIAAKTAYALGPCGADGQAVLKPLEEPRTLYVEDLFYDEDDLEGSVRTESDLAPYKPVCDVIVLGAAHPPAERAVRRFTVSLQVQEPDKPMPLPDKPYPLNPMQPLSPRVFEEWRKQVAIAEATRVPGALLVNKSLAVTGERTLQRHLLPLRLLYKAVALCSLGLVRPNPYRLTRPAIAKAVPLRYEHAQGGQCRIEAGDAGAKRVPKRYRLGAEQQAHYPAPAVPPVAHDSSQQNPAGCGFTRPWFLRAAGPKRLPAPCIEYPHAPFSARRFWRNARGKEALTPAGVGFVGRGWLPRRELVGTFEAKTSWGPDEIPRLPKDFDFRYWNGAPDDQQCRHLQGGERIRLKNLCAPSAPFARVDDQGDTLLSFSLPHQSLFVLAADENHGVAAIPLAIDTVVIDPDAGVVELVWRGCLLADGTFEDARLLHATTTEQLDRLREWNTPPAEVPTPAPATSIEEFN